MSLLDVNNLKVEFKTADGIVTAVNELSFSIENGETLGIVGESGSGKSQSVFSILGLLAKNGKSSGSVKFLNEEILNESEKKLNTIRAQQIAMIFQDPMTSLNPYLKISTQLIEVLKFHKNMSSKDALEESLKMLDAVKIPEAKNRINMYPHEFSGGMRQRLMIAMALLCKPKLLIADEPTTALDVTIQAQIMKLLNDLKKDFDMSIILITHDLGVVADSCDKVLVMYAGKTMEYGGINDIYYRPSHPYTQGLLRSIPRIDKKSEELISIPGNPPNILNLPKGCPYFDRCDQAFDKCDKSSPELTAFDNNRARACFAPITTLKVDTKIDKKENIHE